MKTQLNMFFLPISIQRTIDLESFLVELRKLNVGQPNSPWRVDPLPTSQEKYLALWRMGSEKKFTPLTAVYYEITGIETHYGSFIYPEIVRDLQLPELEVVEIVYASMGLDCPRHYDRRLRDQILEALGLPIEGKRLL